MTLLIHIVRYGNANFGNCFRIYLYLICLATTSSWEKCIANSYLPCIKANLKATDKNFNLICMTYLKINKSKRRFFLIRNGMEKNQHGRGRLAGWRPLHALLKKVMRAPMRYYNKKKNIKACIDFKLLYVCINKRM